MTDPKRWLEDRAAASSLEARVLAAGSELTPPAGLIEQSFAEFSALVGLAGAGHDPSQAIGNTGSASGAGQSAGLSTGAAAGGASLTVGVLKAVGVGLLLGTLTMTSAQFLGRESPAAADKLAASPALPVGALRGVPAAEPPASPASPARNPERALAASDAAKAPLLVREPGALRSSEQAPPARAATASDLLGESSAQAPSEQRGTSAATSAAFPAEPALAQGVASSSATATAQNSALKAEALQLAQAKNLLEQGRANEALTLLALGSQRFAKGVLSDERELLTVQALSTLGRREQARQRASTFLASHRGSPISLRMQRLVDQK